MENENQELETTETKQQESDVFLSEEQSKLDTLLSKIDVVISLLEQAKQQQQEEQEPEQQTVQWDAAAIDEFINKGDK